MTLKINYLDKKKSFKKNKAIFVYPSVKTEAFRGEFDDKINQKIINLIKKNKNSDEDKIFLLNQDFDEKIVVIFLSKSNTELEFEKLGAKFFDYLKKNEIHDIYIKTPSFENSKNQHLNYFSSFIHGVELKSYEFNLYKSKKINKSINIYVQKSDLQTKLRKLDSI